jgi:glycosyltransferase involved in cell wall biosynthesis
MNTDQPLILDAQIFQTSAWDRGMGHYCRALLRAYHEAYGSAHVTIVLNKNLPLDEKRAKAVRELLPDAAIAKLNLPTLTGDIAGGKRMATEELDRFVASHFGQTPVQYLILQLFTFDYCAAFPTHARKFVIIYDMIPLLNWAQFSPYFAPHMYFPHFTTIFEADEVLAISQAAKDQLVDSFGLNPATIINLRGATIERKAAKQFKGVDTTRPFLLMPTADFPHKNNQAAVQAFEAFNRELGGVCQLVLTSDISEDTRSLLECYADNLVFVGKVSDEDLAYLYKQSLGLLFVSSIEGLGLPILEAVQEDKPVVCSSIDVFREIDNSAFYFCDPHNVGSIAMALRDLAGRVGWDTKRARYDEIKKLYTWLNSAKLLHEALTETSSPEPKRRKTDLNVMLPNPAQWNGTAGRLAQAIIPRLTQRLLGMGLTMASGDGTVEMARPLFLPWVYGVQGPAQLSSDSGRHKLYFIDDTDASVEVVRAALMLPGVCIVTTSEAGGLLEGLQKRGYISSDLQKAYISFGKDLDLPKMLRLAGNTVHEARVDTEGKLKSVGEKKIENTYEFANWIMEEAA